MAQVASLIDYYSNPTLPRYTEYEGGTFLRNVGNELPNHMTQQPRSPGYSTITSNSQNTSGITFIFHLHFADKETVISHYITFTFSFSTTPPPPPPPGQSGMIGFLVLGGGERSCQ